MLLAGNEHLARCRQRAGRDFEALADSAFGHDDLLPDTRDDQTRFSGERVARNSISAVPVPTPVRSGSGSKGSRRLLPRLVSAPASGLPLETCPVWIVTFPRQAPPATLPQAEIKFSPALCRSALDPLGSVRARKFGLKE